MVVGAEMITAVKAMRHPFVPILPSETKKQVQQQWLLLGRWEEDLTNAFLQTDLQTLTV